MPLADDSGNAATHHGRMTRAMNESGVVFGTSGARGLVTAFTDEVCAAYVHAFVAVMRESFRFDTVALGMDLRPSSPRIAAACAGCSVTMSRHASTSRSETRRTS